MAPLPSRPPIIRIANGTFYRHHPSANTGHLNPPFFTGLSFALPTTSPFPPPSWCVVGPSLSGKTTLLQVLRGQHICVPPRARSFPYLATPEVPHHLRNASRAIRYVGFDAESSSGLGPATSAYLSARYESRREETDFSLRNFLLGHTQLNSLEKDEDAVSQALLDRVVAELRLGPLLDLPVAFLSNGQGRRARIARALLTGPEVLLLDEPFMGLDPPTVASLSALLRGMAERSSPRLVLSARPQDPLPDWITHLLYLRTDGQIGAMGPRAAVLDRLQAYFRGVKQRSQEEDECLPVRALGEMGRVLTERGIEGSGFDETEHVQKASTISSPVPDPAPEPTDKAPQPGEPLVEMEGCRVRYGDKIALGNWPAPPPREAGPAAGPGLHWTVRRGERWGVFGPNGSGKTTLVSLLGSDHPQAYALPLRLFGRARLPEGPGAPPPPTFWDVQARIGHASPEVHQHMPRALSVRRVIASAWADTFGAPPRLTPDAAARVDACLRWFARELNPAVGAGDGDDKEDLTWASAYLFGELSFSAQRVALFARAVAKSPDIVVLDEAFSGMDEGVRDKCALFLAAGETMVLGAGGGAVPVESPVAAAGAVRVPGLSHEQALVCISHVREEVPDCVTEWLCLPEANSGLPPRFGRLDGPLRTDRRRWDEIWGVDRAR